jgi:type IV secretion system protein TrbL
LPVRWAVAIATLLLFLGAAAHGQTFHSTTAGDILSQMRSFRTQWTTNIWTYAQRLFWFLAFIEFGWSVIALALDKTDLQSWVAGLIRKMMWIGAFYALLVNGSAWIPDILDSFEQIGQGASGLGAPISPSGVFVQGLEIAGSLLSGASGSAFLSGDIASALLCAVGALLIFISYVIITINLIVTLVESYLVVSAGYIFLGFGGSRWTAPYTERYIGLGVSIGIKLLVLYCVIAAGQALGTGWNTEASGIGVSTTPAKTALDVIGGALIYMMCCWQIPKLFGAVIGGSPALTGGDLVMTGTAVAAGAMTAASLGAGAIAGVAGTGTVGAAGAVGAGSSAAGTSAAAGAGSSGASIASAVSGVGSASSTGSSSVSSAASAVRPPSMPSASFTGSTGVRPPVSGTATTNGTGTSSADTQGAIANIGGQPLAGSGFESERPADVPRSRTPPPSSPTPGANQPNAIARGAAKASDRLQAASDKIRRIRLNDSHAPGSPPRMPIDHHE